jgi:hypothetical protein
VSEAPEAAEPAEALAPEAAEATEAPQQAAVDHEDRALAMGWTPKGQFKGDPDKWVDAETFVKRGEEFLPFLKANNKRLETALDRANAKIASLDTAVTRSIEHISKAEQRGYERASREIQARLDEAAANGDVQGVRDATQELVDLTKEVGAGQAVKPAEAEARPTDPLYEAWTEANPWFGKDKAMTAAAIAIANEIEADTGMKSGKAFFAAVDQQVRATFPHKFENPRRATAAAVEGGSNTARKGGKSYADLPPEARQMCDEFVRDIKGFTREQFVKTYDWG